MSFVPASVMAMAAFAAGADLVLQGGRRETACANPAVQVKGGA